MPIKSLAFLLVFLVSGGFSKEHPLKMSFSKLAINSQGIVDLRTRIFLDDITEQMQSLYNLDSVDFSTVESEATQVLEHYLTDHFYFEQNGKKSELKIHAVSFSRNRLAVEVHMNTDKALDVSKELFITNTLLCDADPKQKNDIIYQGKRLRLSASNPKEEIEFN